MSAAIEAVKRFFGPQHAGQYDEVFAAHADPEFVRAVGLSDDPEPAADIPWAGRRLPGWEAAKGRWVRCSAGSSPRRSRCGGTRTWAGP